MLLSRWRFFQAIVAIVLVVCCDVACVAAQSSFFDGKTIRLIVGYPAGTTHDIWARMVTPYLKKYLPGNPDFVVQSMAGAGSMVAVNYLNGVAKPDGLTLATFNAALYFEQLIGRKEVQFDWPKLGWIGSSTPATRLFYIRADHPFATIADLRRADRAGEMRHGGARQQRLYFAQAVRGDSRPQAGDRYRLSGRRRGRSGDRKGRSAMQLDVAVGLFRPRTVSHLAQEKFRARADSDRQQARCPARRRADDLRAYGSVQDAGGEPPFDRGISRRRTLRFLAHRRAAGASGRARENVSRRLSSKR